MNVSRRAVCVAAIALALGMQTSALGQISEPGSPGGMSGTDRPDSPSFDDGSDRPSSPSVGAGATSRDPATDAADARVSDAADDRKLIEKAAKCSLLEARLSEVAAQRATDPAVRSYAETIVNDHQQSNAKLATIALQNGVIVPLQTASASAGASDAAGSGASAAAKYDMSDRTSTGTQPGVTDPSSRTTDTGGVASTVAGRDKKAEKIAEDVEEAVEKLSNRSGEEFDRAYVKQMIKGHKDAIDLYEEAIEESNDPELSGFAQSVLPTLRAHLARAEQLSRDLRRQS